MSEGWGWLTKTEAEKREISARFWLNIFGALAEGRRRIKREDAKRASRAERIEKILEKLKKKNELYEKAVPYNKKLLFWKLRICPHCKKHIAIKYAKCKEKLCMGLDPPLLKKRKSKYFCKKCGHIEIEIIYARRNGHNVINNRIVRRINP